VSRTDDGVGDRAADNVAVATAMGVPYVALQVPDADPGSAPFQAAIAAQIAPTLS
jgi:hypothetical protein